MLKVVNLIGYKTHQNHTHQDKYDERAVFLERLKHDFDVIFKTYIKTLK